MEKQNIAITMREEEKRKYHIERHIMLHKYLDELIADYIYHAGKLFSETNLLEIMEWSYQQIINPSEKQS